MGIDPHSPPPESASLNHPDRPITQRSLNPPTARSLNGRYAPQLSQVMVGVSGHRHAEGLLLGIEVGLAVDGRPHSLPYVGSHLIAMRGMMRQEDGMDRDVLDRLRTLLETTRVLSLGVLVEGEPEVGLLPYAVGAEGGVLYVQASGLARHTRGMQDGARVSVLVHAGDAPDADPMQLTRLAVQATVRRLARESGEFASAARAFIGRFATAAMTLQLGDFNLYELRLGRGRYVEGFARAFNVGPDTFVGFGS